MVIICTVYIHVIHNLHDCSLIASCCVFKILVAMLGSFAWGIPITVCTGLIRDQPSVLKSVSVNVVLTFDHDGGGGVGGGGGGGGEILGEWCEDFGRMVDNSFSASALKKKLSGDQLAQTNSQD